MQLAAARRARHPDALRNVPRRLPCRCHGRLRRELLSPGSAAPATTTARPRRAQQLLAATTACVSHGARPTLPTSMARRATAARSTFARASAAAAATTTACSSHPGQGSRTAAVATKSARCSVASRCSDCRCPEHAKRSGGLVTRYEVIASTPRPARSSVNPVDIGQVSRSAAGYEAASRAPRSARASGSYSPYSSSWCSRHTALRRTAQVSRDGACPSTRDYASRPLERCPFTTWRRSRLWLVRGPFGSRPRPC
jgi:hypothetical protein